MIIGKRSKTEWCKASPSPQSSETEPLQGQDRSHTQPDERFGEGRRWRGILFPQESGQSLAPGLHNLQPKSCEICVCVYVWSPQHRVDCMTIIWDFDTRPQKDVRILYTVKPRLTKLRLSKHLIIWTSCIGHCVNAYINKQPRLSKLSILWTFVPGPSELGQSRLHYNLILDRTASLPAKCFSASFLVDLLYNLV